VKQISLRAFRGGIGDLREPVEVSRRDGQGNIQVLGFWTPYMQYPPGGILADPAPPEIPAEVGGGGFPMGEDAEFDLHPRTAPRIITTPEEAAAAAPASLRAFPKEVQAGRRKRR
jgi:hypothetical protein